MLPVVAALASAGLNLLADAVKAKGKKIVEKKLGIKLPEKPEELTPEKVEELHRIEIDHEIDLMTMIRDSIESISDYKKFEVADRISARQHEVALATSGQVPALLKYVKPLLALLITFLCGGLVFILLFVGVPQNKKEIVMFALGSALSMWGMVVSYYFGTSESSSYKDKVFELLLKTTKQEGENYGSRA
jgi:VIT1/CCC1 family predicted Fe2+/Mn2+ transporter